MSVGPAGQGTTAKASNVTTASRRGDRGPGGGVVDLAQDADGDVASLGRPESLGIAESLGRPDSIGASVSVPVDVPVPVAEQATRLAPRARMRSSRLSM
jgi:hypothetical protein